MISYCTAKLNSQGCTPPVSSAGAPTLTSDDNFRVLALSVLNNKTGIFFWGLARAATPFGGALLCVQPPLVRSGLMNSLGAASGSSCTGSYSFAFDQAYMQAHGVGAGQTIDGQFWSRDPGFVAPNNIGLTRAIEFTVVP